MASRTSIFTALEAGSPKRLEVLAWHALALAKLQQWQKAWDLLQTNVPRASDHCKEGAACHCW